MSKPFENTIETFKYANVLGHPLETSPERTRGVIVKGAIAKLAGSGNL